MLGERIASQSEVIRAILPGDSPCLIGRLTWYIAMPSCPNSCSRRLATVEPVQSKVIRAVISSEGQPVCVAMLTMLLEVEQCEGSEAVVIVYYSA